VTYCRNFIVKIGHSELINRPLRRDSKGDADDRVKATLAIGNRELDENEKERERERERERKRRKRAVES